MGKRILKALGWTVIALGAVVLLFAAVVLVRSRRTFDAPYPDIHASKDPQVIARGAYIAYGAGHCVNCHTGDAEEQLVKNGGTPPLAGGNEFRLPIGTFRVPNLTPDATGIARYTDGELARVIRFGVMPDGRATLPFMVFSDLSDDDLTAVISFLRAQKPVRRTVPDHDITFVGKAILAFLIKPTGPTATPEKIAPPQEATVERGRYLANNVAVCWECHTKRSNKDGSFLSAKFSGGATFDIPGTDKVIVTPNLTPSQYGRITTWSEDQFVGRFGAGVGIPHTHMPWRQFQRMTDTDVRAIYRYLRTLPPSNNNPGPIVQTKKKEA